MFDKLAEFDCVLIAFNKENRELLELVRSIKTL